MRPRSFARVWPLPAALVLLLAGTLPAAAEPSSDFEMPFPCGQAWTGSSRSSHSPSSRAIDWNRTDDVDDPVVAAAPGVVSVADSVDNSGYGKWVLIDHADGESTIYAHLSSVTVDEGQRIDQGAQLGTVGTTGNSTGPHLHFEERDSGADIDAWFHGVRFVMGSTLTSRNCVDVPLAANMVGGPEWEVAVYRRGTPSTFIIRRPTLPAKQITFGTATEEPVLGDWDGDGHANVGVFDPATRTFSLQRPKRVQRIGLGTRASVPVAGDWDGNGTWEVGVRRPWRATFRLRASDGSVRTVALGDVDDLPLTGDWNGDGLSDLGVYDQATAVFTLQMEDAEGLAWTATVPFGEPGDLPVVGDWDGNLKTDLGVWDPGTATFSQRRAPSPAAAKRTVTYIEFGNPR